MESPPSALNLQQPSRKAQQPVSKLPPAIQSNSSRPRAPLKTPKDHNISLEDYTILHTGNAYVCKGLAYLPLHISHTKDINDSIPIQALHDTGCEYSLLSYETFLKLPGARDSLLTPEPKCMVTAFDGSLTPVKGTMLLVMHFTGCNGIHKSFEHTVYVSESTSHDLMIGADFLLSARRLLETSTHIYLVDTYAGRTIDDDCRSIDTSTSCQVALIRPTNKWVSAISTRTVTIPPNGMANIPCRAAMDNMGLVDTHIPFEVALVTLPYASTPNAVCHLQDYGNFSIVIRNDSYDDLVLYPGTTFAQINFFEDNTEFIPISVMPSNVAHVISINRVAFIDNDQYLSEKEKEQAFDEFLEKGRFTPTMTEYVTSRNTVTDFYVKDLKPVPFEDQFQLDHLDSEEKAYAIKRFKQIKGVFSKHDYDLGKAKNFEMDIKIDESKPRIQKYYPLPLKVRDEFRKAMDQMIEYGIVRPCNDASLFCSNLLVTRRKNGQLRILLDGRLLNNATIRMPMNLSTSLEMFSMLSQKKYVSVMDMSHSFFQIPLSAEAQPMTAFYSQAHGRRFCFTRAPQGLKNSPLYLKLLLDDTLGPLSEYVISYADDIMIATDSTMKHHIDTVARALQLLHERGLKMRPSKINLATPTIEFLGIVWERNQLKVPEAKLLAFKDYPVPTSPKKVKSFLGALSFYRLFINRFSEKAKPLMDLTLVDPRVFRWEERHQDAFDELLKAFLEHACLTLPDPSQPYYVQTDASDYAAAGRVFQKDSDDNELLIACVSRTFAQAEKRYSTFRKEVLSMLYALRTLDFFLAYAERLVLIVDAKAIIYLRLSKDSRDILQRFSQELATYEAEVFHIPGKDNIVSDVLSRNQYNLEQVIAESKATTYLSEEETMQILKRLTIPCGTQFSREEVANLLQLPSLPAPLQKKPKSSAKAGKRTLKNMPKTLGKKNKTLPPTSSTRTLGVVLPSNASNMIACNAINITRQDLTAMCQIAADGVISARELIAAQKFDPQLEEIYRTLPAPYFLHKKLLFYEDSKDKARLVLPTFLIKPLLNAKHYSIHGVHHSMTRIKRDVDFLYKADQKALVTELRSLKASCLTCQLTGNVPTQHPFKRFDNITRPKTIWAVDIIPAMPLTKRGNAAIFIAVDMFTAYIQVKAIPSRSGAHLLEAVESCIINPFGIPKYIRCDNEAGLENSTEFYTFCQTLNIDVLPTAAASPWSNGAAERAVQTIKKNLRNFVLQEHNISEWDKYIFLVAAAHNGSIGTYGVSPEEALFGYHYHNHAELVRMYPTDMSPYEFTEHILTKALEARDKIRRESDKQAKRVMTYRNRNKPSKPFEIGEAVLLRQHQVAVGPNGAVKAKFTGPYYIDSLNPDGCTCMVTHGRTGNTTSQHFSNLQKLYHDPEYSRLPSNFDDSVIQLLPDKYSHARYLATQQFDQQSPSRRNVQFGSDTQFGADDQDGADGSPAAPDDQYGADISHTLENVDAIHNISPSVSGSQDVPNRPPTPEFHTNRTLYFDRDSVFGDSDTESLDSIIGVDLELSPAEMELRRNPRRRNQDQVHRDGQLSLSAPMSVQACLSRDDTFADLPITSTHRTDDASVIVASDDKTRVVLTQPDDPDERVTIQGQSAPGYHVVDIEVDKTRKPVQVKVLTADVEDLMRDLPIMKVQRNARRRPRRVQTEDPYQLTYKSYGRPGNQSRYSLRSKGPPGNQSRYPLRNRSKPEQSNCAQAHLFRPP